MSIKENMEIIAAFRRFKAAMEIDGRALSAFMKYRERFDNETCAPNGKVTPRQKAPNHRRPEKRLRKSK